MRRALAASVFLVTVWLTGSAEAEPDRTEALAKAKEKFEADISKGEDALVASIDKALKGATKNKTLTEKLTYEREQFLTQRLVPTAVPTTTYLQKRTQAIAALEAAYNPAIKELDKVKKFAEAEALENVLNDAVKAARGYGLAIPAIEGQNTVFIENKATGQVIELGVRDSRTQPVLEPKASRIKPTQCWTIERDERGFVLQGKSGKESLVIGAYSSLFLAARDSSSGELPEWVPFKFTEVRRSVVIGPSSKKWSTGSVLTVTEQKVKGVTTYELTLEKQESPPTPNQLWVITQVK
jgi:hypothetical protein